MKSKSRVVRSSLAIVEKGFRGALEEQYGNIVWLSECMKAMGAKHSILLCGAAVTACFNEQKQQSIQLGSITIHTISHFKQSIMDLMARGGDVWVLEKDLEIFSGRNHLIEGVKIGKSLAGLCLEHDDVWFW